MVRTPNLTLTRNLNFFSTLLFLSVNKRNLKKKKSFLFYKNSKYQINQPTALGCFKKQEKCGAHNEKDKILPWNIVFGRLFQVSLHDSLLCGVWHVAKVEMLWHIIVCDGPARMDPVILFLLTALSLCFFFIIKILSIIIDNGKEE